MIGKLTIGVKWAPLENAINVPIHRPSVLGNPFVIDKDNSRESVCKRYEEWLMEKMNQGDRAILTEMNRIGKLLLAGSNVNLTCFCKGKGYEDRLCHGEVIVEVIQDAIAHRVIEK